MKVYMLGTKKTAGILPENISDYRKVDFKGKALEETWEPIEMKKVDDFEMKDALDLSFQVPVVSKTAARALKDEVTDDVEFLEMNVENNKYYAMNIVNVIDALDEEKSVFDIMPGNIKFFFEKYAFLKEKIKNQKIFKIKEEKRSKVFVTEELKNKIEEENLEGFDFIKVWEN